MNNNNCNLTGLDVISVMSFMLQMQNSERDQIYKDDILNFKIFIQAEISKLHEENKIIMEKLDELAYVNKNKTHCKS